MSKRRGNKRRRRRRSSLKTLEKEVKSRWMITLRLMPSPYFLCPPH